MNNLQHKCNVLLIFTWKLCISVYWALIIAYVQYAELYAKHCGEVNKNDFNLHSGWVKRLNIYC